MKTMIVLTTAKVNSHAGEDYDGILEVENTPTVDTIQKWAEKIRSMICSLADVKNGGDGKVKVTLDGPPPYNAILLNYQIIMKAENGIEIELPHVTGEREITDPETKYVLSQLDKK